MKHDFVNGHMEEIGLETVANDLCLMNENKAGIGPWLAPFMATNCFDGGHPDALEIHLEGRLTRGDGSHGGAYTH